MIRTFELMTVTRDILEQCPAKCDNVCHDYLMHYWNQRSHAMLDRFVALPLLSWSENAILTDALEYEDQDKILAPLNALSAEFKIVGDGTKHYIEATDKRYQIIAYPSMWNEYSALISEGAISVSDKLLKYSLPKVDALIWKKYLITNLCRRVLVYMPKPFFAICEQYF